MQTRRSGQRWCVVRPLDGEEEEVVVVVVVVIEGGRVCRVWYLQVRNERW